MKFSSQPSWHRRWRSKSGPNLNEAADYESLIPPVRGSFNALPLLAFHHGMSLMAAAGTGPQTS
jgi:hypothetical protein